MSSEDKIAKAYQACTDCHSELTLAQYKQVMREIEELEQQKQQKLDNTTKKNDSTTEKK
jgi:Zn-finger protein